MPQPVGEMKRLVTLVDRGDADQYFFPLDAKNTAFLPNFKPYHNFTHEILELPYTGAAAWGSRITFTMPFPFVGDCLNWVALRFTPQHWLPGDVINGLCDAGDRRWDYASEDDIWLWTSHLGSAAIALVEMEVNGTVIEQWSGDWMDIWQRVYMEGSRSAGWTDSAVGRIQREVLTVPAFSPNMMREATFYDNPRNGAAVVSFVRNEQTIFPTEDGNVYAYFPFWFARRKNAAFPMAAIQGQGNLRFHITLRPFDEVIRRLRIPRACGETVLDKTVNVIDKETFAEMPLEVKIQQNPPPLTDAIMMCGITYLEGELRDAYIKQVTQVLTEPVINISFTEPLKYAVNTGNSDTITISLPLEAANGPVREVIWFIRRKAVYKFNSYTNYGCYMEDEIDPIYKPQRPLLKRAVLRIGAVIWADQDELWWRSRGALMHSGGVQLINSYIYAYSFANDPERFGPSGSMNASRAEMRLDLTIDPPVDVEDAGWEVQVFVVSNNWMRFQNGIAERVFTD